MKRASFIKSSTVALIGLIIFCIHPYSYSFDNYEECSQDCKKKFSPTWHPGLLGQCWDDCKKNYKQTAKDIFRADNINPCDLSHQQCIKIAGKIALKQKLTETQYETLVEVCDWCNLPADIKAKTPEPQWKGNAPVSAKQSTPSETNPRNKVEATPAPQIPVRQPDKPGAQGLSPEERQRIIEEEQLRQSIRGQDACIRACIKDTVGNSYYVSQPQLREIADLCRIRCGGQ